MEGGFGASPDFLVLGLGNPGEGYETTRHNLGFRVVEGMARTCGVALETGDGPYRLCRVTIGKWRGALAQPMTYVNRSGVAARALLDRLAGPPLSRLLVACDDLDLPLGRIRFRRRGSDGGHNGLRSLIEELGSQDFPRLRLGIGRPEGMDRGDVVDHVLEPFRPEEVRLLEEMLERGVEGIRLFVTDGIDAAMNRCNAA